MVNKTLFPGSTGTSGATKEKLTTNLAGGVAYESTEKHAIAQIACTGCFNGTFYADATECLEQLKSLVTGLRTQPGGPEFIAKVAVYSRSEGRMKDMPAYLCAVLASWGENMLLRSIFVKCIDNGKQLRNFIQICRSGTLGKKLNVSRRSIKNLVRNWFDNHSTFSIFNASIGNDPSLADILKMCHVKPASPQKEAMFNYVLGKPFKRELLPTQVQSLLSFKEAGSRSATPPEEIDFRLLDGICSKDQMKVVWENQLRRGNWQQIRMNLNNLLKYGVFSSQENITHASRVLANRENVLNSKCFPYQLFNTYMNISPEMPREIKDALHDALEHSLHNVPKIEGKVYICVDTSGSMGSAVTGNRGSVTSTVRCIDVAFLFASALLRNNSSAKIIPFDTQVHNCKFEPRDSVMTNTANLAKYGGGGTDCSCALRHINALVSKGNQPESITVIMISDNESWFGDSTYGYSRTRTQQEWQELSKKVPQAKLICIDLVPNTTHVVKSANNVLKVGGFSDSVFTVIENFSKNNFTKDAWVSIINSVTLA